ncbi:MAG: MerR family transcriptional regulator [Sediminibacterium sp.]|jgi:MerR family transcriptional regulator, light-induced transcriptional regulator
MDAFTIKDLENLSGIKAHTIRIWEQRYNFLNPSRTDTNIRYYSNEELITLLNIALLNKYGYKISHIDKMQPIEMKERILSLTQSEAQLERIVNELIECMVDLRIDDFESVLDFQIASKGIEKTITQIIFPFLERIGILWVTSRVNPAQEHLVTNIIRQKLIVGIEKTMPTLKADATALLFLPEGEHHELGILFMYYLLKTRGVKVLYLGANVPMRDVVYVADLKKPSFLYTHLTSVASNFNFEKFLGKVGATMSNYSVVVSGLLTQNYKKTIPGNVNLKRSLPEVMDYLGKLA